MPRSVCVRRVCVRGGGGASGASAVRQGRDKAEIPALNAQSAPRTHAQFPAVGSSSSAVGSSSSASALPRRPVTIPIRPSWNLRHRGLFTAPSTVLPGGKSGAGSASGPPAVQLGGTDNEPSEPALPKPGASTSISRKRCNDSDFLIVLCATVFHALVTPARPTLRRRTRTPRVPRRSAGVGFPQFPPGPACSPAE